MEPVLSSSNLDRYLPRMLFACCRVMVLPGLKYRPPPVV